MVIKLSFQILGSKVEGLRLIVSKKGGGDLLPRPGVDPSCVVRISNAALRDLNPNIRNNYSVGQKRPRVEDPSSDGEVSGKSKRFILLTNFLS